MNFDPDVWGTVADWTIVATAVAATWFGREQLKLVVEARRDAVAEQKLNLKVQQGLQLMEIDKQYEGTLLDSRRAFALLRQALLGKLDPAKHREELPKLMSDHIDRVAPNAAAIVVTNEVSRGLCYASLFSEPEGI